MTPKAWRPFWTSLRTTVAPTVKSTEIDAHINDPGFCTEALTIFDAWVEAGIIPKS